MRGERSGKLGVCCPLLAGQPLAECSFWPWRAEEPKEEGVLRLQFYPLTREKWGRGQVGHT